ncbi:hypothetical protein HYS30_00235 [Candidatus Peregrinibacteria bacterium]|nr:hypothetical protein [Candidatus Peregrinibacteria bacterium]
MTHILTGIRTFAQRHDELPAFHAAYLVLTILTAALLNLGTFGLLIVAHMVLDTVKYREIHRMSWTKTVRATFRENLFDHTLFILGFLIAVYLHHSLPGIAGISGLLRSEITIARGLGTLLPKAEILQRFLHVIYHLRHHLTQSETPIGERFTPTERFSIVLIGCGALLLFLAPMILHIGSAQLLLITQEEIIPWHF